jgi:hypothetical protein
MQEYFKYELDTLVDLLAIETARYTKMIAAGLNQGHDYLRCRETISILQAVIWAKTKKNIPRAA